MAKLILMRHGESIWNKLNLFTGWVDVPLSENGVKEALEGGKKIKDIPIDVLFTSSLVRAQTTAVLAMVAHSSKKSLVFQHPREGKLEEWAGIFNEETKKNIIPVFKSWHLNERMYGELQGMNKDDARAKFGKEQVHIWRRSYDIAPPNGESLKATKERTTPYFNEKIVPYLEKNKNVFISAHGNSLRAIIKDLDNLDENQIVKLELPTGSPIIYDYMGGKYKRISS